MSSDLGPQHLPIQNQQTLHMESKSKSLAPHQLSISNKEVTQMVSISHSPGFQNTLVSSKRPTQELSVLNKETDMESMSNSLSSNQLPVSNQEVTRMVSMSSSPRPQNTLIPTTRPSQTFSFSNVGLQQLSAPKKRMTQLETAFHKMGGHQSSGLHKRNTPMEPSPKGQTESFELVRAKLRESLADALALVSVQHCKTEANSESAAPSNLKLDNENAQLAQSVSTTVDVGSGNTPTVNSFSKDAASPEIDQNQVLSKESSSNLNLEDATQMPKHDGQDFQLKYILLDEDVSLSSSFLLKDDFLQGNGLCWATDLEVEVGEAPELHSAKKPKLAHEEVVRDGNEQPLPSPKVLATRIEAELFKLFGGVNKKYKEKGRSLIFNLKDRNNPELRERVMSGEIPPERLCSMTAEELASKELSQWRIAKAEELAQMVVLPDSEVNVRRLVKKTHKGEFQVEFEQDDGASVEVAVGGNLLSQYRIKTDEKKVQSPKLHETEASVTPRGKANVEARHPQSGLATSDGTDPMHGLVVDDLKDAEFLPPIVSLDEFMESLDSEPPFESLPEGAEQSVPTDEKSFDVGSDLGPSDGGGSRNQVDTAPDKLETMEKDSTRQGSYLKPNSMSMEVETSPSDSPKGDHLWEGSLQLNISSMATVSGFFKSGEKTSVKEWQSFLDIKGRVRLDAFGKFLQELHMSRSRAIMVLHFCQKEGSPESGSANLSEVAESYVADERVGLAEPAPGVELYFCPPHGRTVEMLGKHLPKDDIEMLNAINNGLIGIVVWRKPHVTSTLSPKSSAHHKHSSKKNNHLRRQEKNSNTATPKPITSILGPPPSHPPPLTAANTMVDDDDDDDVPPGFGPAVATTFRDDDDLPEFDFVGNSGMPASTTRNSLNSRSHIPPRPVEQMRELVNKYGRSSGVSLEQQGKWQQQSSRGGIELEIQPWNDDDDIPEWRPQPLQQQQPKMTPPPPPPQSLPPPPPPPSFPSHSVQLIHSLQQQQLQPSQMNLNLTQNQALNSHHHFAPIAPPSQQLLPQITQRPLPMQQPLQAPMNANVNMNMNVMHHHGQQQNWQAGSSGVANWPPNTGPRGPLPGLNLPLALQGIGMTQPCSLGPPDQFYGTQGVGGGGGGQGGGLEWRADVSRGF